jgi:glycosyltransferase involved in cell wall biosynthesis
MQNKKTLILILAYNAESTILQVLNRIPVEIWDSSDILVADDSSQDKTAQLAREYKTEHNKVNLKIVHHDINKGYGGNQKWAYNYAIENSYDIVCMVHGDIQYAPEYIGKIIQPLKEESADFVFGSRMTGDPLGGGMPIYKYLGNKFLTKIENIVLGTNLSEFHSGFRAYNVWALKDIPFNIASDKFHFDSDIIIQLIVAEKKIKEITIPTFYGKEICYVNVVSYGLNILNILKQYILTKLNIIKYKKFIKDN